MNFWKSIFLIGAIVSVSATWAQAGPYTDQLSQCLVESTSQQDRTALVRWMFSAASRHQAVKDIALVSEEQLDEANRNTAALFMKLLTESCRNETEKALEYEGEGTISTSFNVLGQVAGRELFASPDVAAALAGLDKYLDKEKLESLSKAE